MRLKKHAAHASSLMKKREHAANSARYRRRRTTSLQRPPSLAARLSETLYQRNWQTIGQAVYYASSCCNSFELDLAAMPFKKSDQDKNDTCYIYPITKCTTLIVVFTNKEFKRDCMLSLP